MTNNVRYVLITALALIAAVAVLYIAVTFGERAWQREHARMTECTASGGTYISGSTEMCLIGTELK